MLSNPLHRVSPYHAISSSTLLSNGHISTGNGDLDTLGQGSDYALQQLEHVGAHSPHLARSGPQAKHRQNPYGAVRSAGAAAPIRRRISRACDQCNQLRTKCDGQHPCAHCMEFGLGCEYIRERKKRGKTSRKDLAQQAAAQAAAAASQNPGEGSQNADMDNSQGNDQQQQQHDKQSGMAGDDPSLNGDELLMTDLAADATQQGQRTGSMDSLGDTGLQQPQQQTHMGDAGPRQQHSATAPATATATLELNAYGTVSYERQAAAAAAAAMGATQLMGGTGPQTPYMTAQTMSSYPALPYALQPQSPTGYSAGANAFGIGNTPLSTYPLAGEPISPLPWMTMPEPSPPPKQQQQPQRTGHLPSSYNPAQLRYPVLLPLVPHLGSIVPLALACDLVDLYFASSSSAQMHPMSPYVLGFVFRKRSFLHPTKPRQCQPALLASMLWVAAQTSDAPFLTSVPSARGKICQKLLELTVGLLKPLIHTPHDPTTAGLSRPLVNGLALGGLGVAMPSLAMDAAMLTASTAAAGGGGGGDNNGAFGAAGSLDDVITYIHLATVVSASEYKGASLRWWNCAWSLARELKLGRELPGDTLAQQQQQQQQHGEHNNVDVQDSMEEAHTNLESAANDNSVLVDGVVSEEEREERRRIWWLVYIVDRHLALCYNRPLFLLDVECDSLLRPMDDTAWQNGEFGLPKNGFATDPSLADDDDSAANNKATTNSASNKGLSNLFYRPRGPSFACQSHSIYGYFMPLMTILGEIVDLHHARNHPRFGMAFRSSREWDDQTAEIARHLAVYEQSLKTFEQHNLSPSALAASNEAKVAAAAAAASASSAAADANGGAAQMAGMAEMAGNNRGGSISPQDMGTPSVHSVHSVHTVASAVGSATAPSVLLSSSSSSSSLSATATSPRMTEQDIQTRIVTAYGTHVMHVLHILLSGKWDPINLLDDNDLWISSQGFITATGHAVSAAEAIGSILEYDPGLEFMPFFFGIYLLQGSFLMLLIADKLQREASTSVVRACETIVRAHEACVVTLNTEYQVMRSALALVRGRVPEDLAEQHMRRRELLGIYRWTGDGTGLAL